MTHHQLCARSLLTEENKCSVFRYLHSPTSFRMENRELILQDDIEDWRVVVNFFLGHTRTLFGGELPFIIQMRLGCRRRLRKA